MKKVADLQVGDGVMIAYAVDLKPYGEPVTLLPATVTSNVLMRDNSGDYGLTVKLTEHDITKSERLSGDAELITPDDPVIERVEEKFKREVDEIRERAIEDSLANRLEAGFNTLREFLDLK